MYQSDERDRVPGSSCGDVRHVPHDGGAQSARARGRSGAQGSPQATEPRPMMDLTARLRSIVRGPGAEPRELRYEPDTGRYEATIDLDRVASVLGGRVLEAAGGRALVVDRRYEGDRRHGDIHVADCEFEDGESLRVLDPSLPAGGGDGSRILFVDLETTGLSGGAGTIAFLVGCAWFDCGALQVRQFLLTSYASERALLAAVAACVDGTALLVTYNGKTFDVPVMETRWLFHRLPMPLDGVRHFDMLHPARRLWRGRPGGQESDGSCRLSTLERVLFDVRRVGDVPGMDIPSRYFHFVRTGDAFPLEPVLEHNRLDLVSLAAVTAHGARLASLGRAACRDGCEALALGRIFERAGDQEHAGDCYDRAASDAGAPLDVRAEALSRIAVRHRRERRFAEAAAAWRQVLTVLDGGRGGRSALLAEWRRMAAEALAIHHEHRERDYAGARELALLALEDADGRRVAPARHRLSRLDRKLAGDNNSHLFG
ncbi:MAG TPA: ribonuclease H-like domain-containing protein [Vicinamibacterales bacterium]|nr:ribonuclease H-like domain-containing protein [Vicinamibacterales bacterium]